jgi:hypothetical protein
VLGFGFFFMLGLILMIGWVGVGARDGN